MRTREMLIPNAFASPFPRFCRMHVSGVPGAVFAPRRCEDQTERCKLG